MVRRNELEWQQNGILEEYDKLKLRYTRRLTKYRKELRTMKENFDIAKVTRWQLNEAAEHLKKQHSQLRKELSMFDMNVKQNKCQLERIEDSIDRNSYKLQPKL
ncbi:hypothetical protein CHUAL_011849 [Chamberlinius hualienensis]